MTRDQAKKHLAVITAYSEGKKIQIKLLPTGQWTDMWDDVVGGVRFDGYDYRIKPEKKKQKVYVILYRYGKTGLKKTSSLTTTAHVSNREWLVGQGYTILGETEIEFEYEDSEGSPS